MPKFTPIIEPCSELEPWRSQLPWSAWARLPDPWPGRRPPVSYAADLEEFLDWTDWRQDNDLLTFNGLVKGKPDGTEAENRVSMLVNFDRLCHKLEEIDAPLARHPEFHIDVYTHGELRGTVTIQLWQDFLSTAALAPG